jgi:tetratricopeptide (TPR) repeat protein
MENKDQAQRENKTEGGAYIEGDVKSGGDFVGKDKNINASTYIEKIVIAPAHSSSETDHIHPSSLAASIIFHNLTQPPVVIGREHEIQQICDALVKYSITTIIGEPGTGKTALALEVAKKGLNDKTYDGIIWITANAVSIKRSFVLDTIVKTFQIQGALRLQEIEKIDIVYDIFRSKKCLILFDNFENIDDPLVIQFIEGISIPSRVLITTQKLHDFPNQYIYQIKNMIQSEALRLMDNEITRLGLSKNQFIEEPMLKELFEATCGNPLAIKWAIGQAKSRGESLEVIVGEVNEGQEELLSLLFDKSWELLREESKSTLLIFAVFSGQMNKEMIEFVTGFESSALEAVIAQLLAMSLIEPQDAYRKKIYYVIHPLTRRFLYKQAKSNRQVVTQIKRRLCDYYQKVLDQKNIQFSDLSDFYDDIDRELQNILELINYCFSSNFIENGIILTNDLSRFLWSRGYWDIRFEIVQKALEKLDTQTYDALRARLICDIAWIISRRGENEQAISLIKKIAENGETTSTGYVELTLSQINFRNGNFRDAEAHILRSIDFYEKQNSNDTQYYMDLVEVWDNLGDLYRDWSLWFFEQNNKKEAKLYLNKSKQWYSKVLDFGQENNWLEKIAVASGDLGHIFLYFGNYNEALTYFEQGLENAKKIQRKHTIAYCNLGIGELYARKSYWRFEKAIQYLEEAEKQYLELGQKKVVKKISDMLMRLRQPAFLNILRRFNRNYWIRY